MPCTYILIHNHPAPHGEGQENQSPHVSDKGKLNKVAYNHDSVERWKDRYGLVKHR
jgi:hypothetical protein